MKLYELKGVKKFHNMDSYEFNQMLKDEYGIECIGGGTYGQIYTNKDWDYVVKVISGDDPFYLSFVDFVLKNPDPHFPKIKRKPLNIHAFLRRHPKAPNNFWVLKIEKLEPIKPRSDLANFLVRNLETYAVVQWQHENGYMSNEEFTRKYEKVYKYMPDGVVHKSMSYKDMFDEVPWFSSLCRAYMKINQAQLGSFDNHDGNFMKRKDGTIVMIDPIWEGSNPMKEFNRMMAIETDSNGYEDDLPDIKGPVYKKKQVTKEPPVVQKIVSAFDDDIPF